MKEDVKGLLKEAREAIKNKDYESAIKLSKQVLKADKDNYTAFVFLGVSYQEITGQSAKTLSSFNEAIRINPTNALAWNGLANYYEKIDDVNSKLELVKVYCSLLNTETNEKKLVEYCEKLANLAEYAELPKIVDAIYSVTKNENLKNNTNLWTCLASLISKKKDVPNDILSIYEEALSVLINTKDTVSVQYYADYLNVLYKQSKSDETFSQALSMHSVFEKSSIAPKWICKIFNENYVESGVLLMTPQEITRFYEFLLNSEPNCPMALFTKAILLYEEQKLNEAKELLTTVVEAFPGLLHAWILLLKCANKLYLYNEAAFAANKLYKLVKNSVRTFKEDPLEAIIAALSQSDDERDIEKCLALYKEVENVESRQKYLPHIITANIALQRLSEAKTYLFDLKKSTENKELCDLYEARILRKESKYNEALDKLKKQVERSDWWMEIGLIHWDLGEHEKCLMPFLKAAKLEPNNFQCFRLLGDFYSKSGDLEKARRCYEKAFKLNARCSEVALELSKIYRRIKNWDASVALLQSLTSGVINRKNSWAWLQLGLNYLEQQDYDKAIANLRFVIRLEETNVHCWEALADSYLAKGAYTSALKCYEKAAQHAPDSLYPLLQLATIKQILGDYEGARADFHSILSSNKVYVPALKGMAETCMCLAKECYKYNRLGAARDHAQSAAKYLTVALNERGDLACLWKLFADSCMFVTTLPELHCCLVLAAQFAVGAKKMLEKDALYTLAARCYCKALTFVDDCLIWRDLGACYLAHAVNTTEGGNVAEELLSRARSVAQYCTQKEPTCAQHWNLLGNVAVHTTPKDFALAQHCFIKAVIADRNNNAVAWCNLGTLYFISDDFKLANEAFSQAQRSDPNYVNSWIGQALLAEMMGHEDAMDLFRHSTQLALHKQGSLGYAHWVCQTLKNSPLDVNIYSIHNMHAIPVACDVLSWYTEYDPMNGSAWNMLGILRERMGLKQGACESFKTAVALSDKAEKDLAKINYGRSLANLGKLQEAIDIFHNVEQASLNSGIGLALALFKAQRYKESYESYEAALHWLTDSEYLQSDLLVALASMAYMFEGPEIAKTLLFQCIQLKQPSPWGFYATFALGVLHDDLNLATLVLKELQKLMDKRECLEHLATLSGFFYLLQGKSRKSVWEVSKLVHRYPNQPQVWLSLALLLIRIQKDKPGDSAAKCAQIALRNRHSHMDVTKVLCWVSLSSLIGGDSATARISAQKAVHSYPNVAEGWAMLYKISENTKSAPKIAGVLRKMQEDASVCKMLKEWICKVIF